MKRPPTVLSTPRLSALRLGCKALTVSLFCCFFPPTTLRAELVINELMYHPYAPWGVTNSTEYLEIYNPGTSQVSLATYRLDNGVSYSFSSAARINAGGYVVVCEDTAVFTNAYRTVTNCVGQYSGSLRNGGERVTLSRFNGTNWVTADTIEYVDGGLADGKKRSLELVNPCFAPLSEPFYGSWRDSLTVSGTPGRVNSVYTPYPAPVIGDVRHDPPLPLPNSCVTISAQVLGLQGTRMDVLMKFRKDANPQGTWSEATMWDNGYNGDSVASDGIYAATIPTNGGLQFAQGQLLEYTLQASDSYGVRAAPGTNTTGQVIAPYSYLCYFGDDTGFNGEYPTYHLLMTAKNRQTLETRGNYVDYPLMDATLITSDGKVFYNCGARYRGGSSRVNPFNYRVELPRGREYDGFNTLSFNHDLAINQFIGMTIMGRTGYGCEASTVQLARLWLNETDKSAAANQGIYCRIETFNSDMLERIYPNADLGNLYTSDGDSGYTGDLSYLTPLSAYYTKYFIETNWPPTAWLSLSNLCWTIAQDASRYPTILSNRIFVRQWARHFATQVCLDNGEAGIGSPSSTAGDELRIYCDPSDRQFEIFPWDFSNVIGSGARVWGWGGLPNTVQKILFNRPALPFYVGDCRNVMDTAMSQSSIARLFDEIGTKGSTLRTSYTATIDAQRTAIRALVATNLTVRVNGSAAGTWVTVVATSGTTLSASFSGTAPMNYTDRIRINSSTNTTWDLRNNAWSTVGSLTFSGDVSTATVQALDSYGNVLRQTNLTLVAGRNIQNRSGIISANTSWNNSAGTIALTDNITVTSGATLTVQPDTVILVYAGKKISVTSGRLNLAGTAGHPVRVYPYDGSSVWSIEAAGSGSSITGTFARVTGGRFAVSSGAGLDLSDSVLYGCLDAGGIVAGTGSGLVRLRRNVVERYSKLSFDASPAWIEDCLLQDMSVHGIEFLNTAATAAVLRTTLRRSAGAAGVDGVRFTSGAASGIVSNCLMHALSGSGIRVAASTLRPSAVQNLAHHCGYGLYAEAVGVVTNSNNTVADCTVGLRGAQVATHSSIVWGGGTRITNGPPSVTRCDVELAGTNLYAGTGNLNRNPWFRSTGDGDYSLLDISPARGAGVGGSDMGARPPFGASPRAPSGLAFGSVDSGAIGLHWSDNSGDEAGFEVQTAADGAPWTTVTNLAAGATNWTHAGLAPDTEYAYRVRSFHDRGQSLFSDTVATNTHEQTSVGLLQQGLRLTEIMYNPTVAPPGNPIYTNPDSFEFLELSNVGGVPLSLTGLRFTAGITYSFPTGAVLNPGAYWVLVSVPGAFASRYPGIAYSGVYTGQLSNGGETLRIKDAADNTILAVTYDDDLAAGWYPTTDGEGYSLVLANAADDPDEPSAWRASTQRQGSPGADDPAPSYGTIVINEVLAHTDPPLEDAVELYNAGTSAVNIAGWYLSNSATNLMKYRITNSVMVIPPGGYRVFYEGTSFNRNPGAPGNFEIKSTGDDLYLSSGTNGTLTSYRTWESFGASENGISFGRYVTSDGGVDFVAMSARTFGADNPGSLSEFRTGGGLPNAYPKVGPVVINEIMYNPSAGGREYVELLNPTGATVPLYDPAHPTNSWKFNAAMEFTFPPGAALGPGAYAVVSSLLPAEFRRMFGVTNPAVQVFGPFAGDMDNAGESVKLYKPDPPEATLVPDVLADRVKYGDNEPWPAAADNDGASLERRSPTAYGNDPTNWLAATVGGTPGAPNNLGGLPSVAFVDPDSNAFESNQTVNLVVTLQPPVSTTVTVHYARSGGTATPGTDFTLSSGTLVFWPHDTEKRIPLQILNDGTPTSEPDETVEVTLSSVSPNARLGGNVRHTLTLVDTDTASIPAPTIQPVGTTFIDRITVTMSTGVSGAEIHYTTDGSTPTRADPLYTAPFNLTFSARVTARAFLGSYNAGASASQSYREQAAPLYIPPEPGVLRARVGRGTDDAEERIATGLMTLSNPSIELGYSVRRQRFCGFLFTNVAIPKGVAVTNAYIQFVSAASNSVTPLALTIYGHAADNPGTFRTNKYDISARPRTTNFVIWTLSPWIPESAGAMQRTPNLAPLLNEITARPGWNTSNSVAFLFVSGTAYTSANRTSHAYDVQPFKAALLYAAFPTNALPADADGDGMPDDWEVHHFGGTSAPEGGAQDDWDADGMVNLDEYVAGTDPTNPLSLMQVFRVQEGDTWRKVFWSSVTNRLYSLYKSTNLVSGWIHPALTNDMPGHPSGTNTYTDATSPDDPAFYKVKATLP